MESQSKMMGSENAEDVQRLRRDVLSSLRSIEQETQQAWNSIRNLVDSVRDFPKAQSKSIDLLTAKFHTLSLQVSNLVAETDESQQAVLKSSIQANESSTVGYQGCFPYNF